MKRLLNIFGIFLFMAFIGSLPAAAAYFDKNGAPVDKGQYDQIVRQHEEKMGKVLEQGYGETAEATGLPDPVLLRKKRIEQWKALERSRDK